MHLVLTGATGLVGSAVLDAMLKTPAHVLPKITVLSRRPVRMVDDYNLARHQTHTEEQDREQQQEERVRVILHRDFARYDLQDDDKLWDRIRDATGCVWALGIGQFQVGKDEYIKITKDYPLRFAEALQQARSVAYNKDKDKDDDDDDDNNQKPSNTTTTKPFHFVYVSGEGATHHPGRFTPLFGRVKGEAERALGEFAQAQAQAAQALPPPAIQQQQPDGRQAGNSPFHAIAVRPAFVDPSAHAAIQPYLGGLLPWWRRAALALLGRLASWVQVPAARHSPTEVLGRFLTGLAMGQEWQAWQQQQGDSVQERAGVEKGPGGSVIFPNAAFARLAGLGQES